MCILEEVCEEPTEQGVWWRDDTEWRLYSAEHQALIRKGMAEKVREIDLGTIVSVVHPLGAKYTLDLHSMRQVAVNSGQVRPVMVVDAATVGTQPSPRSASLLPPSSFRNLPLNLHYKGNDGNFHRYGAAIEQALFQRIQTCGSQHTVVVLDEGSGHSLSFDFEAMEQRIVSHFDSNEEPVLSDHAPVKVIVEVPWDAAAMASMAAKADKCLRRKILSLVIERYRSDESLDSILEVKAQPRKVISKSSRACSVALYERFIDSLDEVLQTFPNDAMGDMLKAAGTREVGGGPVQIAFKPVDRETAIPSKRKSLEAVVTPKVAFWMSMAAPVAAAHATVYGCAVQILAYLVIIPFSSLKKSTQPEIDRCSGYVEVARPEHGLPLAEITVT